MSHLYELSLNCTIPTNTLAAVLTIAASSTTQAEVREIAFTATLQAARFDLGVGIPAANGTGTITGTLVQACDPDDPAGQTTLVAANGFGTTQPTTPANFMRRFISGAVFSSGVIFTWEPYELIIPPSGQLVLWQNQSQAGTETVDINVKVWE